MILITGGRGFLGRNLCHDLDIQKIKYDAPSSKDYDLRRIEHVENLFFYVKPTIVIHLAGKVGGIKGNNDNQYDFYYDNITINTNVVHTSLNDNRVKYILTTSSVCVYPQIAPHYPITEDMLNLSPPEPTNQTYAYTKRMMQMHLDAWKHSNKKWCILYSNNLYGPSDHFGQQGAHVIPDLIHKLHNAKLNNELYVELMGTGQSLRQFTYAPDLCKIILNCVQHELVGSFNIGNIEEVTILALANLIKDIVGYKGNLYFNGSLDGQMRRSISIDKFTQVFYKPEFIALKEGLEKTYEWFLKNEIAKL
jgi:GDP-L-fucose synthase